MPAHCTTDVMTDLLMQLTVKTHVSAQCPKHGMTGAPIQLTPNTQMPAHCTTNVVTGAQIDSKYPDICTICYFALTFTPKGQFAALGRQQGIYIIHNYQQTRDDDN